MIISLSFLEFKWKILYHWKANILNFFMAQKFFCILKIFWVMNFWTKIMYFFTISKNIISPVRIKKNFCFVKTLSCIDYFARKFLEKNMGIDNLNMSVIFRQVNFLNFVKILKEEWSIFSDWNSVCNSESQNLINEDNFWQKLFAK